MHFGTRVRIREGTNALSALSGSNCWDGSADAQGRPTTTAVGRCSDRYRLFRVVLLDIHLSLRRQRIHTGNISRRVVLPLQRTGKPTGIREKVVVRFDFAAVFETFR